jgi:hypothetical protein
MSIGRLSALQVRVLQQLAGLQPPWTLTGGGALAGFRTQHRDTRDLDLFFRDQQVLGEIVHDVRQRLELDGLQVAVLRTSPMFMQLDVRDGQSSVIVDLVADPTPIAEPPELTSIGDGQILVETPHQLLVNKLCALLSRSELRDLIDVRELLAKGENLVRALEDCPRQDAGFSPLTFGWSMRGLRIDRLGAPMGLDAQQVGALERFRDELVERVMSAARPAE